MFDVNSIKWRCNSWRTQSYKLACLLTCGDILIRRCNFLATAFHSGQQPDVVHSFTQMSSKFVKFFIFKYFLVRKASLVKTVVTLVSRGVLYTCTQVSDTRQIRNCANGKANFLPSLYSRNWQSLIFQINLKLVSIHRI